MSETEGKGEGKVSSAQLRKIKKPIIERRRRERINESLNQLKTLVLDALNKDESRFSKMEKADILEMTVKHLKVVHQQQQSSSATVANRYIAGFHECAQEVSRYLACANSLNPDIQNRLANHLNNVAQKSSNVAIQPNGESSTSSVQVPSATPAMSLPGLPIGTSTHKTQVVPILPVSSNNSNQGMTSQSSIPITVPAGGVVTILQSPDHPTSSSPNQGSDLKPSVIPLYINTGMLAASNGQLTYKRTETDTHQLVVPAGFALAPTNVNTSVQPQAPSSFMSPTSSPSSSYSPKTGAEAPQADSPPYTCAKAPSLSPETPTSARIHSVISHTQTALQTSMYSQDCRTAIQKQVLPMHVQNQNFYQADVMDPKGPVWRPW